MKPIKSKRHIKLTYCGPNFDLVGLKALVRAHEYDHGAVMAQFDLGVPDDMVDLAYGWHKFNRKCFMPIPPKRRTKEEHAERYENRRVNRMVRRQFKRLRSGSFDIEAFFPYSLADELCYTGRPHFDFQGLLRDSGVQIVFRDALMPALATLIDVQENIRFWPCQGKFSPVHVEGTMEITEVTETMNKWLKELEIDAEYDEIQALAEKSIFKAHMLSHCESHTSYNPMCVRCIDEYECRMLALGIKG